MASPARLSLAGLVAAAILCPALGAQVRTADTAQVPTSSNRRIVRTAGHLSPLPTPTGDAGSWPSFRGVRASGFAEGQLLPDTWDVRTGENILWRIPIPGLAHSSPIVWGDRIFVTTAISSRTDATFKPGLYGAGTPSDDTSRHRWVVYAIEKRTGTIIWERVAYEGEPIEKRHIKSTYASATPATDGRLVVASFGSQGVYAYNFDGTLRWKVDLGHLDVGAYDVPTLEWGTASSPIIWNDLVFLQCDTHVDSFVVALSALTGELVWKSDRVELPSWGTPTIVTTLAGEQLVTNGSNFIRAYDPRTGKELWRLGRSSQITAPTPIFADGLIVVASGRAPERPIFVVRSSARGDITLPAGATTSDAVAWSRTGRGPYMPTPLAYKGLLYVLANNGVFHAYTLASGDEIYQARMPHLGSGFSASPVAADGKIYVSGEDGDVIVVAAGSSFTHIATNPMGAPLMATPALSQGVMFVRTSGHLFAISRSAASAPGAERIGRALIDEGHHNYHTSSGGYAAYARLLGRHDVSVAPSQGPITRDALAKTDVFISAGALPEPYDTLVRMAQDSGEPFEWSAAASKPAYSPEEIATIREWVRGGGSLLLVVDHAPYGVAGGQLAAAFGVDAGNTITTDGAFTVPTELLDRPGHLLFSRQDGLLGNHPTLTGVNSVVTYTGTSLTAPPDAAVLLRLPDSAVDRIWNPIRKAAEPVPRARRAQAVALEYGAGRVVVLGEAGMLTTDPGTNLDNCGDRGIALADAGNRRFGLNIARWLARKSVDVDPSAFVNTGCIAPPRLTFVITGSGSEHAAFAGTWRANLTRGQTAMTVNLRLEGNRVSGEMVFAQTVTVQGGTVAGDRISFTVPSPNGQRIITFTGTLNGDEMAFVRTVQVKEGGAPGGAGLFGMGGPPAFVAVRAKKQ